MRYKKTTPKLTLHQMLHDLCIDAELRDLKDLEHIHLRCRRLVGFFLKDMPLTQVTDVQVHNYIMSRIPHVSRTTINRELQVLKQAFTLYKRRGYIVDMPNITRFREDNARQGFFTSSEVESIITHIKPYLKNLTRFAYITGWRKREITTLQWMNIHEDEIHLKQEQSKNKTARVIYIVGFLAQIIEEQKQNKHGLYIFHHNGKEIKNFNKAWNTACTKANVHKLFHDLRRTAVRNMRLAGISEVVAMKITGHKTRQVFDRYNIIDGNDIREALKRLG